MKRLALCTLIAMLIVSLAATPIFMTDEVYGETEANPVFTNSLIDELDGKNVTELEKDETLSMLLEDPTFLRYFDITSDGRITKKKVNTSDVDAFISKMEKSAEGINNEELVEVNENMTSMGCGVSGVGAAEIPKKYKSLKRYNCVDVSWWQGKISDANWQKVKDAGVTCAIIRCGYSTLKDGEHNTDSTFAYNLLGAYNAGLKVGVYYYSTAITPKEAKSEAKYVEKIIKSYKSKISLPVTYDYETGGRLTSSIMKSKGTDSCIAFCDYIKSAGYRPMVYANYTTLCKYIDRTTLEKKYKIWLANYTTNGVQTTYPGKYCMWQYSSSGKVNGLKGNIDINYVFDDGSVIGKVYKKATTTCRMNYRTGPGMEYDIAGSYKKGTKVSIAKISGDWVKLKNGYYMNRSHLKYKATVKKKVNYRTGPGKKYKVKGKYQKGKTITIVSVKNGWAKISNGYYVSVKYTKMK